MLAIDKPHDVRMCDQGLFETFYLNSTFEFSYVYNANLVTPDCEPAVWERYKDSIVFLHFTVAKPWMRSLFVEDYRWTCPWWNIEDLCELWART